MSLALACDGSPLEKMGGISLSGQQFLETVISMDISAVTGVQILTAVLNKFYSYEAATDLAQSLLTEFGNVAGVVSASRERACSFINLSSEAWATLQLMRRFAGVVLREPLSDGPLLNDLVAVYDYLMYVIGQDQIESCRILYLNVRNHLIRDEVHSSGSIDSTVVYPRDIVRRVCELKARAIIIAHNHPSGDPVPSHDDHVMTMTIQKVLDGIGASLHDHLIIGRDRYYSFRQQGFLE